MDDEGAERYLTPAAVFFGVLSSAWLLSAFGGDVEGIFSARDGRFYLLVLTVAATAVALNSKIVGLLLGLLSIAVLFSQSYAGRELDVAAYRWALLYLVLFSALLWLHIRMERKRDRWGL